ncbi:MaoC-like dehydratase [Amycolatopsis deserti]|uniref:MaoC-like dehydratase n=1 Tax=Amycolatopsis deserti TaxID=185696 RepID=A0ABQ3ITT2_9PSEU|nr:MaoC family dehydratase [Amycolatopsis deserti]GHE91577.1 MaoC-like dehydratase [Amycolatopsis deserti]
MTTVVRTRGLSFEDFEVGREFVHHWGRTFTLAESIAYSTRMMHHNPMYFDEPYARRLGYRTIPINQFLVYSTVLGLSVEDLSEAGGPFLGIEDLVYGAVTYAGDTVRARSEVLTTKVTRSRPGWGVVEWRTTGYNQRDEVVVEYRRANLSKMRAA